MLDMLFHFYSFLCLCGLPSCLSRSIELVPYWIVEILPTGGTSQLRSCEFYYDLETIMNSIGLINLGRIGLLECTYELHYPSGKKDTSYSVITQELLWKNVFIRVEQQRILPYSLRAAYHLPTDPQFKNQWPWFNTGQTGGHNDLDINVVPIWIQGVSGSGSTVAVIDDGVQITHPDLSDNIDLTISYSFITGTNNPTPILSTNEYSHGTNCAGEIVMVTNNGRCGTGVAYNAKLGGIQFNLSDFRPAQEAAAFQYRNDAIQIYSNSYGPTDDGFTVGGPGPESIEAIDIAINQGRNKLGSIYVFSSGNGGENGDSCAADGFINNRHIIGVGSANQNGQQAFYDENCSGKMATTYTFNNNAEGSDVVTTFVPSECVSNFTGTSASAPLVSGVIALALEVNANLSWRDVQYLIAYTSDSSQLVGDWIINGGGLRVSPQFGFGAIDAEAYVNRARHWDTVDDANSTQKILFHSEIPINRSHSYNFDFMITTDSIRYLEHVIFTITFDVIPNFSDNPCYERNDFATNPLVVDHLGAKRGDAQITVCSPSGTCSLILPKRPKDFINCEGYSKWDFMSVHFWAENPIGNWSFSFTFDSQDGYAVLQYVAVNLYGIYNKPTDIPESCDPSCKRPMGCSAGNDSIYCDRCGDNYYRNVSTMECVQSCSPGACVLADTCLFYDGTCPSFAETSSTNYDVLVIGVCSGFGVFMVCVVIVVFMVCLKCSKQSTRRKRHHTMISNVDDNLYHDFGITSHD